jgi:hypothetical protein
MTETNTLAYYDADKITSVKIFLVQSPVRTYSQNFLQKIRAQNFDLRTNRIKLFTTILRKHWRKFFIFGMIVYH